MRKNRLLRLVLAATFAVAAGAFVFAPRSEGPQPVEWVLVDETNPIHPPVPPNPSYDGDGTSEPDGEGDGDGGSGENGPSGSTPEGDGEAGEPEVGEPGAGGDDREGGGGLLGLSFPAQAGMSVGVIALAFLALLPGRRMPERLR